MKLMKKAFPEVNTQSFIVSLCFLAVCINTQQIQTNSWNSGMIEFSRDSLGVLMALILFTHYKWGDFIRYKIPYLVWSVLGLAAGVVFLPMAVEKRLDFLLADTIVIAVGIFLMGYCVIHTAISFLVEKRRPKFYRPLFCIWIVMLVLMIFSKTSYLWPLCYFTLFLTFYLTYQTPEQRTNVVMGMVNGIILGYTAIQGHSLLCRPYDRVRYVGNFCNPNNNSIFLCMCLSAILAKILFVAKKGGRKIERIFYFLMAGTCYSFICLTMSRSGYLTAFVLTLFFLAVYCRIREKRIFIRTGLLLVSLFAVLFPITYLAVRYIPTIHPHVLFYFQEGYSESRVHSWDDRNSEKFVDFEDVIQGILGRFGNLKDSWENLQEAPEARKWDQEAPDSMEWDREALDSMEWGREAPDSMKLACSSPDLLAGVLAPALASSDAQGEELNLNKIPLLDDTETGNSLIVRYTIYKWFFTHMTWRGVPYNEQGFQLTEYYWVQHAHNIYLDYGINYGFPVMILFTLFTWWGIGRLTRKGMAGRDCEKLACLFIVLIPPVYGLFEYAWGTGLLSTVAFYFAFKEMFAETPNVLPESRV